jgi:hypothetical protein
VVFNGRSAPSAALRVSESCLSDRFSHIRCVTYMLTRLYMNGD